ncbi:MAG: ferritin-like domain-containing protein [Candidatus Acidiferrales bacterium]
MDLPEEEFWFPLGERPEFAKRLILLAQSEDLRRSASAIVWNARCIPRRMMTRLHDPCAESKKWIARFSLRSMTALYVSPLAAAQLTAKEIAAITRSIQQFQLGEGSKGQRLLDRGKKYGSEVSDPFFVGALDLFIKEEQQHSRYLEAFMQSHGIPIVGRHWVDSIFRKLRGLAGLELSLAVLVTAEIIAMPYYRALRDATGSPTLKNICRRILEDEATHLKYQASMLARLAAKRHRVIDRAIGALRRLFLLGTTVVVWFGHRAVFQAAGYGFRRFRDEAFFEFDELENCRRALNALRDVRTARASGLLESWTPSDARILKSGETSAR